MEEKTERELLNELLDHSHGHPQSDLWINEESRRIGTCFCGTWRADEMFLKLK